jgi:hypothetical protein
MNANTFVQALSKISLDNVFNPYSDICPDFDKKDAASIRRKNLRSYLTALHAVEVDTIWMGRDLGYRGGRRTGLALTDERHLKALEVLFPGIVFCQATNGPAVAERTAAEIWAALPYAPIPPLFWNVFPFHPHEQDSHLSNRRFTKTELTYVEDVNASLIEWLGIKRVISIGQDALQYAKRFGVTVQSVRHPSYGGVSDFRRGIAEVYGVKVDSQFPRGRQKNLFGLPD